MSINGEKILVSIENKWGKNISIAKTITTDQLIINDKKHSCLKTNVSINWVYKWPKISINWA